jgi:hypothetical protein
MFLNFYPLTFYLYYLVPILYETFDVVIPPGVAGPEVENTVVGIADVAEVAEPELVVSAVGAFAPEVVSAFAVV